MTDPLPAKKADQQPINKADQQSTRIVKSSELRPKSELALPILEEKNYVTWKWHMAMVLESKGLDKVILGQGDEKDNSVACSLLASALNETNKLKVVNCSRAKDIWITLMNNHENKSITEKQYLLSRLHGYKIRNVGDIGIGISEIQGLAAKISALGTICDEATVVSVILNALPPALDQWKEAFELSSAGVPDLNRLITSVISKSGRMKNAEEDKALVAKDTRQKSYQKNGTGPFQPRVMEQGRSQEKATCFYCKKPGHWKKDCRSLKRRLEQQGVARGAQKPKDIGKANRNLQVPNTTALVALNTFFALSTISPDAEESEDCIWTADSGCSFHMTNNQEWITNYQLLKVPKEVQIGDGKDIKAIGIGEVITEYGTMKNVHHVPDLKFNLFSIGAADEQGIEARFNEGRLVFSKRGKELFYGFKKSGAYYVNLPVTTEQFTCCKATLSEWHKRFGHISNKVIERMAKDKIVQGLEITSKGDESTCEQCALGKSHRAPHPSRLLVTVDKPGQSLHMDTVGPILTKSLGGAMYFVLSVDEYSGYRMVEFVADKTEIKNKVKEMITKAKLETKNDVLQLTTDNGSEFVNENLKSFLESKAIIHKTSAPYTPQQNGRIERAIRTVVESARTLLLDSKLPYELWAEAINTAVYVLNRTTGTNSRDKSPYELWFGKKPNVRNLHVFGQSVVSMTHHHRNKFEPKGDKQIFVGYTDLFNTFRLYDQQTGMISISSDVGFINRDNNSVTQVQWIEETVAETETLTDYESDEEMEEVSLDQPEERAERLEIDLSKVPKELRCSQSNIPPPIKKYRLRSEQREEERAVAQLTTHEATEDPQSFKEAMDGEEKKEWLEAMQEEMDSMYRNKVWKLVKRPADKNIVSCKWVFRTKRKPNGDIERYRARLVARGFSQVEGIDYNETYAPVVDCTTIRLLLAYAAVEKLCLGQFDVKTAFLYGDLSEEVYMDQPEGFKKGDSVCHLIKSLYGLKQAPRQWNIKFTDFLKELKLSICGADACVFYRHEPLLIIAIYVDDGLILARTEQDINNVVNKLKKRFDIHTMTPDTFLGFQIAKREGQILVYQESYITKVLKKFNMIDAKPVTSPMTTSFQFNDESRIDENVPFRQAIGSLMYASTTTRIDITYAVARASRFSADPTMSAWKLVKNTMRYLQDKKEYGLLYSNKNNLGLQAYCDADFAGDKVTGKSTTGMIIAYGGAPIYWCSKLQKIVTLSSTEAEFVSLCSTIQKVVEVRKLAIELGIVSKEPTMIHSDNESAIKIASNEKSSQRTRHMSVRVAYPKEQIEAGNITIKHVRADDQIADSLTKPILVHKFVRDRERTMVNKAIWALTMMMAISFTQGFVFERTKPIIWIATDKFVDVGVVQYVINYTFVNPCKIIDDKFAPNLPSMQPQLKQPILKEKDLRLAPGIDDPIRIVNVQLKQECELLYRAAFTSRIDDWVSRQPAKHTHAPEFSNEKRSIKRSILSEAATTVISIFGGVVVSNLVAVITSRLNPSSDYNRLNRLEPAFETEKNRITEFESRFNATKEVQRGMVEAMSQMGKTIREQQRQINHLAHLLPQTTWLASYLQSRILSASADLKTIIDEYVRGRVATLELSELLNITEIRGIEPEDTSFERVDREPGALQTINMQFTVREKSKDTFVYKVMPFNYWENLTEIPSLMEYVGPRYIIYNEAKNCIKGISDSPLRDVREECNEINGTDPELSKWRVLISTNKVYDQNQGSMDYRTLKFNYVYCFPWNITIKSKQLRCPPYAFRLPLNLAYSTMGKSYTPKRKKFLLTQHDPLAVDIIHNGQFYQASEAADECLWFDKIQKLRQDLQNEILENERSVSVAKHGWIWWITVASFSLLVLTLLALSGYNIYLHHRTKKSHKSIENELRDINEVYGTISRQAIQADMTGALLQRKLPDLPKQSGTSRAGPSQVNPKQPYISLPTIQEVRADINPEVIHPTLLTLSK